MSITVELPCDTQEYIAARAEATGIPVEEVAADLLRRAADRERLDAAFGPVQRAFEESGLTDGEVEAEAREILTEVRRERVAA